MVRNACASTPQAGHSPATGASLQEAICAPAGTVRGLATIPAERRPRGGFLQKTENKWCLCVPLLSWKTTIFFLLSFIFRKNYDRVPTLITKLPINGPFAYRTYTTKVLS